MAEHSSIDYVEVKMTWRERLFNKDCSTFKKYIESTTAHGVVRIFQSKSIIRRLFWLVIVLSAASGCLYNISDRIRYLVSSPTATTISITRSNVGELSFPAVTVCNLNYFRMDVLQERNIYDLVRSAFDFDDSVFGSGTCNEVIEDMSISLGIDNLLRETTFEKVALAARNRLERFILFGYYAGERINISESFEPIFTRLGICYTFNSGKFGESIRMANGTGQRQGLQLLVNVNQSTYSTAFDAGVKVAIHPQSEPPLPDDQGIGVPPGRNAFISLRQKDIEDKTGRTCNSGSDISHLNFLQGEYTSYSGSACLVDCQLTSVADSCKCIASRTFYYPDSSKYDKLRNCTLEDICCVVEQFHSPITCDCEAACSAVLYETSMSYSYFPADYRSVELADVFNITPDTFPTNHLAVNIYFETLNIETQTTSNAYSFIALLSDIGGQLGLFLGVSVISIMEFGTWIIDEIKNRIFGMGENKMKRMCCSCSKYDHSQDLMELTSDKSETSNDKELHPIT